MIELIRAWQIGPKYFVDEQRAWAYAKSLADKYSRNRPEAFNPKPTYLLRAEMNSKVAYLLIKQLEAAHEVME